MNKPRVLVAGRSSRLCPPQEKKISPEVHQVNCRIPGKTKEANSEMGRNRGRLIVRDTSKSQPGNGLTRMPVLTSLHCTLLPMVPEPTIPTAPSAAGHLTWPTQPSPLLTEEKPTATWPVNRGRNWNLTSKPQPPELCTVSFQTPLPVLSKYSFRGSLQPSSQEILTC